MNYIKHLTGFFDKVAKDKLLNPTHVSLYIALFQFWNVNRFRNPISISRHEIMRISKISSLATYHRCLKLLDSHGYIKYEPSFNPYRGSHVYLFNFSDELKPIPRNERTATSNFELLAEQVANKLETTDDTSNEQVSEQALVPSINNTNNTNNTNLLNDSNGSNLGEYAKKIEDDIPGFLKSDTQEKEKSSAKKEKEESASISPHEQESVEHVRSLFLDQAEKPPELIPDKLQRSPTIEEVLIYFREQNYPELEASKFFNYFTSIGWLVGGKTPMADWPAAARNWMINAPKFTTNERTDRTKSLDTSADKDYSEPL
ncbi:transcriptional regulator [Flavobacterium sp.]|uniref:transcriptional regulator n=1 Tax=Flavobacterium sp. TaxID=239 RepID=UPI0039E61EE4